MEGSGKLKMNLDQKLVVDNISKKFQLDSGEYFYAIKNISLTVEEGHFITILGPSGCGKTTLLKIVAGLIESSEGEIFLNGKKIEGPSIECGLVTQAYTLFPWLTAEKNIEFGLRLKKVEPKERKKIVDKLLDLIGLSEYKNFYPKSLSGGMKQRVAIARTLAVEPEILLMDEPFGALDTQTRSIMQENLLDIWEKTRKTVLFVTHDIEEAIFLSDVIYISTASPGTIKTKLDITLPKPRDFRIKTQKEFVDIKSKIIEIIRQEAIKAVDYR